MRSGLAGEFAGLPELLQVLKNDVLRDLGARGPVKAGFDKDFKAFGCLGWQDDREGLGVGTGGRLGHALLLQCLSNAFKLILATGVGGLPIAADGISDV